MIKAADRSIALSFICNVSVMKDSVENKDAQSPPSSDPIFIFSQQDKWDDVLQASAAKFFFSLQILENLKQSGLFCTMHF